MTVTTSLPGLYVQPEMPAEFGPKTLWVDTSLSGSRFPAHPGRTYVVSDGGAGVPTQEPNVYVYNGVIYLLVNRSGNLWLLTATNPRGPWSAPVQVMGGGIGGEASGVIHPSLFVEDNKIWVYYIVTTVATAVKVATATMAAVAATPTTAFGGQATVFQKAGGVVPGLSQFGNFAAIKIGSTYRLYIEAQGTNTDSWQTFAAECATPNGTFVGRCGILASLDPAATFGVSRDQPWPANSSSLQFLGYRSTWSAAPIFYEAGQYVTLYHAGPYGSNDGGPQSDLYRATSPDGLNWSIDLWSYPFASRQDHRFELDQLADPYPVNIGGIWWLFYTAANNPNNRFVVKACPLSPTMTMSDGYGTIELDQTPPPVVQRGLIRRARVNDNTTALQPFDDFVFDPGAGTSALVLPSLGVGGRIAVQNISATSTGCLSLTAPAGNTLLGSSPFYIPAGQRVEFTVNYELSANGQITPSQPSRIVGTATLVAGTVTVSDTRITAAASIKLSTNTVGGTPGALYVSAKTPGTSFVITSTNAGDTSVVNYEITFP